MQDLVRHFFVEKENDWREMLLHHIAALALYPGFIFGNILPVGVVLAWLHDLADVALNLCRIFHCIDLKWPTGIGFVFMACVWFYTRLLVLPIYIHHIFIEAYFPPVAAHLQPLIFLELVYLMLMQVLHIFWFFLIIRMMVRMITTGE